MQKTNQRMWVLEQLNTSGRVSRNDALNAYITRLGAIIHQLNKEGYNLEGHWVHTKYGKDYIYKRAKPTTREVISSFGW